MKKIFILLLVMTSLLFFSCKKKSSTPDSGTTASGALVKTGTLTVSKIYSIYTSTGTLSVPTVTALAYFYANTSMPTSMSPAGNVSLNAVQLKFNSSSKYYQDTTYTIPKSNPATWNVTGAGVIPSFTFTNNDSLPDYTGFMALPDTIYRSQTLNVPVNGVSGASSITVAVLGSGSNSPNTMTTSVSTNNTLTITASAIAGLSVGNATLEVILDKYNDQTISGSDFRFVGSKIIIKSVYVK